MSAQAHFYLDTKRCDLYPLCAHRKAMLTKVNLVHKREETFVASSGLHKLHDSVQSLNDSVAHRCHLCTLIWEALHNTGRRSRIDIKILPVKEAEQLERAPNQG
jgi:hypothetical protein